MATTNGTLKYKQDDGSIVELNPVGVDNTARSKANAAQNAIGTWGLDNPISTIAQVVGGWDAGHSVSSGETITNVLDGIASQLSNEITARKNADTALDTRVKKLEKMPALDLPIIGIFIDGGTGNDNITFDIPIPSIILQLQAKGHIPTFSISGGTVGAVFEYTSDGDSAIHQFRLSNISVSNLGLFVSITGKPSVSPMAIRPGAAIWGSYKQAAFSTSLHVTFS